VTASSAAGWIIAVVVVDGLAALVGGLLPDRFLRRARLWMFALAAVMLLASGAGELVPEGVDRIGAAAIGWAAGAFAFVGLIEWITSRRRAHRARPVNVVPLLVSDGLHNFADGIAIAASFLVSLPVGLATSAGVILHELPEELADFALLRAADVSRRRALVSLALVQVTAGVGAVSALALSAWIAEVESVVVSIAGGMFIYIGLVDLVPELVREVRAALPAAARS
jgi:zinc and cadmium transporter